MVQTGLLHPAAGGSRIIRESLVECGPFGGRGVTGDTTGDEREHGVRGCLRLIRAVVIAHPGADAGGQAGAGAGEKLIYCINGVAHRSGDGCDAVTAGVEGGDRLAAGRRLSGKTFLQGSESKHAR